MPHSHWQPTAQRDIIIARAKMYETIRNFFAERHVLEVETPLLSSSSVTDIHLYSFSTNFCFPGKKHPQTLYLQTSPEYAMKRLLANDLGSIYQITKAFRNEETGRYHNPEFTLLEWYRVHFNHHQLMDEMDALLQTILGPTASSRRTYQELFQKHLDINPHTCTLSQLKIMGKQLNLDFMDNISSPTTCLQILMTHVIEPKLPKNEIVFVYDFPEDQAALAKIRQDSYKVAERFEVYLNQIELANGFHELGDPTEQRARFEKDLFLRKQMGREQIPIDENLLQALAHGFPSCAGVALGLDRLLMLANGLTHIDEVLSFPIERA